MLQNIDTFALDQPLWTRHGVGFSEVFTGRLGVSYYYRQPVVDLVANRFPVILELGMGSTQWSVLVGGFLGWAVAGRRVLTWERRVEEDRIHRALVPSRFPRPRAPESDIPRTVRHLWARKRLSADIRIPGRPSGNECNRVGWGGNSVQKRMLYTLVALIVVVIVIGSVVGYVLLTAPPAGEKVLVVGTTDDETTFDPADAYDYFSINVLQNVMAMLLTYVPGTTNLTTDLLSTIPTASNGGISQDGLNYTIHLKPNLKFEDGTPINASTLKYSWDRVVKLNGEPAFLLGYIAGTTEYWDAIGTAREAANWTAYASQGVRIVDTTTVVVHLRAKFTPFPYLLALSTTMPVNPSVFKMDKLYPNATSSSGPYRMTKYIPHQRYEFTANANYYGTAPKMARVTVVRYTNAVDLKLAIQTGAIDVAYRSLLPQDFKTLKQDANLKTLQGESPVIRYLVFNMCSSADQAAGNCPRVTPFSNANGLLLRKALAYATNRTDIVTNAYNGTVSSLYSLIPAGMFGHEDVFTQRYGSAQNIAQAQALLTQAGYSSSSKFTFTLWYTPSHYGDPEIFVAQALKRAWEATGMVSVTIDQKDWAAYKAAWRSGSFDVFLLGWFPDYFDPDDYVFPFLHWASGGSASFGNWYHNTTMDQVIESEAAVADLYGAPRGTIFGQIQGGLAADVPYLPLFQTDQTVVFKPNVSGIVLDPIQYFRYFTITVS